MCLLFRRPWRPWPRSPLPPTSFAMYKVQLQKWHKQKLASHIRNAVFVLHLCIFFHGSPRPRLRKAHATTMTAPANKALLNPPMRSLRSLLPTKPTQTLHKAYRAKRSSSVVQVPSSWIILGNVWFLSTLLNCTNNREDEDVTCRKEQLWGSTSAHSHQSWHLRTQGPSELEQEPQSKPAAFWFHTCK